MKPNSIVLRLATLLACIQLSALARSATFRTIEIEPTLPYYSPSLAALPITISPDGSIVGGEINDVFIPVDDCAALSCTIPFTWTSNAGTNIAAYSQPIPLYVDAGYTVASYLNSVTGLSTGGSTILLSSSISIHGEPVLRSSDGNHFLRDVTAESPSIFADGMSSDGSVIAGTRGYPALPYEAYRWTQAGGFEFLSDISGGVFQSITRAVSGDGSTVVGVGASDDPGSEMAFRWTRATGMQGLGKLRSPQSMTERRPAFRMTDPS